MSTSRTSSKNYSIEIKDNFKLFDYRQSVQTVLASIYVEEICKIVKTLPPEGKLPAIYPTDKLWSEEPELVAIFLDMCKAEFDKKINERILRIINDSWSHMHEHDEYKKGSKKSLPF